MLATLGLAFASGCATDSTTDASLHVDNQSDFSIVELHVAPVGSTTWGPNLLSDGALAPGDTVSVDVTCDHYDALLVDDTGVDCQINDVDLCLDDARWVIHNDTCAVFGAAAAARAAAAHAAPDAGAR